MKIILEANGLWEMIEPNEKTQADNKKDKTAIAFLYQALPEDQLLQISKHKTAKAIWNTLKTRHLGEDRVQQASITDIKSVLTRKGFNIFCQKFHIPEEVYPELPSPSQTIHEMPSGKIGVYTRFFEFANFRLHLSTFLVDILRYYRIHLSQHSVIGAAKVSHFEILCRVHNIEPTVGLFRCFKGWMYFSKRSDVEGVCYTKPLDSLKHWNDHLFWVDSFTFPASFPWHTTKNVSKDPFPKSINFNPDHYAILVAHPAPFRKFPEPFCCLVGMSRYYTFDENTYSQILYEMDLLAFIHVADPTKVKVVEREPRAESELEASVDKLFYEGGSADQGNSVTGDTAAVTAKRPKRHSVSEVAMGDKSPFALRELLTRSLLNVEAGVKVVATLPFVTSFVSATPEREYDNPTDLVTGANLRFIVPAEMFVISPYSSHHSRTHASGAGVASVIRPAVPLPVITEAMITAATAGIHSDPIPETSAKVNTPVHVSMFYDLDFVGTEKPDVAGPSHLFGKELSLGSREVKSEHLHEVFIPHWNISNDALLNDLDISREFVDHLAPPVLFSQIRDMDYKQLFTECNVRTAHQVCLNAEVRMLTEYCLSERKMLELECVNQANLLKARDDEVERLKAQLLLKEAEAAETIRLRYQVFVAEATKKIHADEIETLKQRNVALKTEKNSLDGKVAKLDADLAEMVCHLEEKFYPHLLTTISGRRWLLVHGLKLVLVKCLNSSEYLTALGAAISRAIEKGMQDGLAAGIGHGREGRSLTDVAAYKPYAKADFNSALQELCPLADAPGMGDLQPDIEQLKVPIHRLQTLHVRDKMLSLQSLRLYAPFPNASVTSYGPSRLVLKVGMPISTGITAFVPYVSENGVYPLLDLIIVYGPTHRSYGPRKDLLYNIPFIMAYRPALWRMALVFPFSSGRISFVRWAKLVDAILLSASAFLFSPLGTCLIENSLKVLASYQTLYSASLLVVSNLNLRAYVNSIPSRFVMIRPALEPSMHEDPSVNNIHGSESASSSSMSDRSYGFFGYQSKYQLFGLQMVLTLTAQLLPPSSVRVEPIAIVCFGYSRWIATWIFSSVTWFIMGCGTLGTETIVHSNGIILLFRNMTVPPATGNFRILDICPSGHIISPLNLISGVVTGTIRLLNSGWNLLKQCSYRISEEEPPSTYMRDFHAFWSSLYVPTFKLVHPHEFFCEFTISLLDIVNFNRIFDAFFLLEHSVIAAAGRFLSNLLGLRFRRRHQRSTFAYLDLTFNVLLRYLRFPTALPSFVRMLFCYDVFRKQTLFLLSENSGSSFQCLCDYCGMIDALNRSSMRTYPSPYLQAWEHTSLQSFEHRSSFWTSFPW
nr:transposase (putative), gypsy type [Tanacetum cinerariifolium]